MVPADIPDDIPWALLDRYLAREVTGAERVTVERWLRSSPGHRRVLDAMREIPDVPGGTDLGSDSAEMWHALERRLTAGVAITQPQRCGQARGKEWARFTSGHLRVAVVALGVLVAIVSVGLRRSGRLVPGAGRVYATHAGQHETVTLADGTQLTLAPASRLTLSADYGRAARDVMLEGEALFTVAHDAARPFRVHAGRAVATDIGTRFDVRAYAEDAAVRVAVTEGEVCLRAVVRQCDQPLKVGDLATATATGVAVQHQVDVAALTAWAGGSLVFARVAMRDAVRELSRWYDLDITLTDPADTALAGERLTAAFHNQPAEEVLAAVAAAAGVHLERHGRTVRFGPRLGRPR